jgi:hypothetical protein
MGWTIRDRIPLGARLSAPVQTGPEAHPASCTMGTGSFPGVRCGRGVMLTPHPLLVPRSKSRVELLPLLSLRTFVAYDRVKPTYDTEEVSFLTCCLFVFLALQPILVVFFTAR